MNASECIQQTEKVLRRALRRDKSHRFMGDWLPLSPASPALRSPGGLILPAILFVYRGRNSLCLFCSRLVVEHFEAFLRFALADATYRDKCSELLGPWARLALLPQID